MAEEYKQPRHNETSAEDKPKHQAAHKTHESKILHNNSTRRTESGWENMRKAKFTKMADIENEYNHKKEMLQDISDTNGGSLNNAPYKLAAKQNILKRRSFKPKSPQIPKEAIQIDLFKVKYEKIKNKCAIVGMRNS